MHTLVPLVVANAAVLVFGGAIAHLAYRASRRTGSVALCRLAGGGAVVTAGTAVGGAVHSSSRWTWSPPSSLSAS